LNSEESFFTFDYETDCDVRRFTQEQSMAIAYEAKRLAEKYDKDTFDCKDLQKILNLGKNNVRNLLNSSDFPSVQIGNRKLISALSLASWLNHC
jgi:hypothetical protein